jgi:hypothetical protein
MFENFFLNSPAIGGSVGFEAILKDSHAQRIKIKVNVQFFQFIDWIQTLDQ